MIGINVLKPPFIPTGWIYVEKSQLEMMPVTIISWSVCTASRRILFYRCSSSFLNVTCYTCLFFYFVYFHRLHLYFSVCYSGLVKHCNFINLYVSVSLIFCCCCYYWSYSTFKSPTNSAREEEFGFSLQTNKTWQIVFLLAQFWKTTQALHHILENKLFVWERQSSVKLKY